MDDDLALTCFTNHGLISKKQFLFHDSNVKCAELPLHVLNLTSLYDMYNRSKKINNVKKTIYFILSTYLADLITALFHSYILDRNIFIQLFKKSSKCKIDEINKKIIINTNSGYASPHHIFPSNWKDIDDKIIIRDIFILLTPLFILNHFNPNNDNAFLNYSILYQLCISGVTHKYAHERNHSRYVPNTIKVLQDLGLVLSGKKHKKHHIELYCNYSLLNGSSDKFANSLIKNIDKLINIKPHEEIIDLCKKYVKKYGDDIIIKFVGDIEGEIVVNLSGNIIKMAK